MLKIIEYGLLVVSLLVVIGLIMTGPHSSQDAPVSPAAPDPALLKDNPDASKPGKTN